MKNIRFLILAFVFSVFLVTKVYASSPWTSIEKGLDHYDRIKTKTQNTIIKDVNSVKNNQQNTQPNNRQYKNQQNSSQSQQQPDAQNYQQNTQQQPDAAQNAALKDLPQGTLVVDVNSSWNYKRMRNYTGEIIKTEPVAWLIVSQGNYGQGKTLLLSKEIVANYNFYGKNQNSMTNWQNSDIRAWLRSTFYNHLSAQFKNAVALVNTETPTMAGKPQTVQDSVFILSTNELGLTNRAKNGKNTSFFVDEQKRKAVQSLSVSSKGKSIYQPQRYWLRTYNMPNKASGYGDGDIFVITNQGLMNSLSGSNWGCGVRPAVNLKSDTVVSGPYDNGIEQYYVLFNSL